MITRKDNQGIVGKSEAIELVKNAACTSVD